VARLCGRPDDVPDRYAAADPARLGPPLLPVTALHGEYDEIVPVELSLVYAERTGQPAVVLPGADHFGLIDPDSTAWPAVLHHLAAAVRRTGR
jgi:pimeloyl-ACP methyl ester carboxylesterase